MTKNTGVGRGNNPQSHKNTKRGADHCRWNSQQSRKWADVSGGHGRRFDIETWDLDGGRYSSPGNVYPCRDAREKEISRIRAWRNLSDAIDRYRYSAPPNVTIEAIQQAAELLGLEVKPS